MTTSTLGENCRSGCRTRDHKSFGECARSANLQFNGLESLGGSRDKSKAWDKELQEYRDARAQGIQPSSTRTKDIRKAVEVSEKRGYAFDGSKELAG